jgi:hypothetical protein
MDGAGSAVAAAAFFGAAFVAFWAGSSAVAPAGGATLGNAA